MYKAFANRTLFVITYIILLLPTYFSSYVGVVENGLATMPFSSLLYVLSMMAIVAICFARGALIGKHWLVLIPVVAFIFNLTPALTAIPFVPFVYHVLAITLGAALPLVPHQQASMQAAAADTTPSQC